jgi:hypothetical protein
MFLQPERSICCKVGALAVILFTISYSIRSVMRIPTSVMCRAFDKHRVSRGLFTKILAVDNIDLSSNCLSFVLSTEK